MRRRFLPFVFNQSPVNLPRLFSFQARNFVAGAKSNYVPKLADLADITCTTEVDGNKLALLFREVESTTSDSCFVCYNGNHITHHVVEHNYTSERTKHITGKNLNSYELCQILRKIKADKNTGYKYAIPHKWLYQIDQAKWDEFILNLQHQDLVKLLNLSKNRHLYPSYNYAVSSDNPHVQINRATILGRYQFLQGLLGLNEDYYTKLRTHGTNILELIDQNIFPLEILKQHYLPTLSKSAVKKLTELDYSAIYPILGHSGLVSNHSRLFPTANNNKHKHYDQKLADKYIERLPYSTSEPDKMAKLIDAFRDISDSEFRFFIHFYTPKMISELLYNDTFKTHFIANDNIDIIFQFIDLLYTNLFYPKYKMYLKQHSHNPIRENKAGLFDMFLHFLAEKITLKEVIQKSLKFRELKGDLSVALPGIIEPGKSLGINVTINGIKFTSLYTMKQLEEEANAMKNCVKRNYSALVPEGKANIISATSDNPEQRATINIMLDRSGANRYYIKEIRGIRNSDAPHKIIGATDQLIEMINSGKIPVVAKKDVEKIPKDCSEQAQEVEDVYKCLRDLGLLSKFMQADNYNEMIKNSEFEAYIKLRYELDNSTDFQTKYYSQARKKPM